MESNQRIWAGARDRMAAALRALGYPDELADLLARQLKSPRAMDRMAAYLSQARPASLEMIIDEMLAICADVETWRRKKESQEAQAHYNAWLDSDERWQNLEEETDK